MWNTKEKFIKTKHNPDATWNNKTNNRLPLSLTIVGQYTYTVEKTNKQTYKELQSVIFDNNNWKNKLNLLFY